MQNLERQPGKRDSRYAHLFSGEVGEALSGGEAAASVASFDAGACAGAGFGVMLIRRTVMSVSSCWICRWRSCRVRLSS